MLYMVQQSITWICLRGTQKITNISTIDSPNGGFPIGKIKNHLKQTQDFLHTTLITMITIYDNYDLTGMTMITGGYHYDNYDS